MPGIDLDATPPLTGAMGAHSPTGTTGATGPAQPPKRTRGPNRPKPAETPPRSAAEIMAGIDEVVLMIGHENEYEDGTVGRRLLERLTTLIDDLRAELRRAVERGGTK